VIATAPGKLILTGEYAVLDGAPALVVAVNRRVVAARQVGPRGSSPFLAAVADELAARGRRDAAAIAMTIAVDSRAFYDAPRPGLAPVKLGLGSSAAVTVAATALALGEPLDRNLVFDIAAAAHARAQQQLQAIPPGDPRATRITGAFAVPSAGATLVETTEPTFQPSGTDPGVEASITSSGEFSAEGTHPGDPPGEAPPARRRAHSITASPTQGSGADVASAVVGGMLAYTLPVRPGPPIWARRELPRGVTLIPFFTGASADTRQLVAQVAAARTARPVEVNAALAAIADASRAAAQACDATGRMYRLGADEHLAANALLGALALAARAIDALAVATQLALVPACVTTVRAAIAKIGGVAKTTGAGGGDVAIAALPATEDATVAMRCIIEAGGKPLALAIDPVGVDLRPDAA
jgi:phosphomevalonate kinase